MKILHNNLIRLGHIMREVEANTISYKKGGVIILQHKVMKVRFSNTTTCHHENVELLKMVAKEWLRSAG